MYNLRYYQKDSLNSIYDYFSKGGRGNPLLVLPTGSGKSIIIASFIKSVIDSYKDQRIIVLTHVKELVEQNSEKTMSMIGEDDVGIYSASLKRRDCFNKIIFGNIQSVYKKSYNLGVFNLILVDECHLISNKSNSMYNSFISDQKRFNKNVKVIGFTATPFRLDSGHLINRFENSLFTDIIYDIGLKRLISEGYLCDIVSKEGSIKIDLSKARSANGDYIRKDVDCLMSDELVTNSAINEIIEYGQDRKHWLVFCSSTEYVKVVRDRIRGRGITCEMLTSKTDSKERDDIIDNFKSGKIKCLCNVNILTTGFDFPAIDLICILNATKSIGKLIQIIGRGLRTSPGKENCLILDYGNHIERFGHLDTIDVKPKIKKKKKGEAPKKKCPNCECVLLASSVFCQECGYEFTRNATNHEMLASKDSFFSFKKKESNKININMEGVANVSMLKYKKNGSVSLKVSYVTNSNKSINEWVFFEHKGYPRLRALEWWKRFYPLNNECPEKVDEAIDLLRSNNNFEKLHSIVVDYYVRIPKIVKYNMV